MKRRKREVDDVGLYSAYDKVARFYQNNEIEEAIKEVKEIITKYPYNPEPYIWLGDLEFEIYNLESSLKAYQTAIDLDEQSSIAYSSAAKVCFFLLNFGSAEEYADRALNINPEEGEALYLKALLLDRKRNFVDSDLYMKKANLVDPENYPKPLSLNKELFENIANSVFDRLPVNVRRFLTNVSLVVEDIPDENDLAINLTPLSLSMLKITIDKKGKEFRIILFKRNLEHFSENEGDLKENINTCILNEINKILSEIEREQEKKIYEREDRADN